MGQLTDAELKKLIKKHQPVAGISDGDGLTFTMSKAQTERGQGSWVFRYRYAGKPREMTLGNYPDMPLDRSPHTPKEITTAREAARAARVMVDLGKDVAGEKRRAKADAVAARTFREISEEHLSKRKNIAPRSRREWHRYLEKDIYPEIGHIAIGDVSVNEVRTLVKRVAGRSQSVGRRVFEMLSVVFSYAMADGAITENPCAGLKVAALVGEPIPRRQRLQLTLEELPVMLASLPALGRENELVIRILLATCVRKSELFCAKKADLNLDAAEWHIPPENAKTRSGYVIPLAPVVVGWFRELIGCAGDSQWVLPARNGPGRFLDKHVNEHTLNKALERVDFGIRAFSPHDLRSTARSYLTAQPPNGLGVSVIVAERCLNHKLGGLLAVYDQHDYLQERRQALEAWAKFLTDLEPKGNNVVPLRAAA